MLKRFWDKVTKSSNPDACWGWTAFIDPDGYGKLKVREYSNWRHMAASRLSWLIHIGSIPKGKNVCHTCDNPQCTNPKHLWLGTARQNQLDKVKKQRQAIGSNCGAAKLNETEVREIKIRIQNGETDSSICLDYRVSPGAIWWIRKGVRWAHVNV
jgi:hypothetical protein